MSLIIIKCAFVLYQVCSLMQQSIATYRRSNAFTKVHTSSKQKTEATIPVSVYDSSQRMGVLSKMIKEDIDIDNKLPQAIILQPTEPTDNYDEIEADVEEIDLYRMFKVLDNTCRKEPDDGAIDFEWQECNLSAGNAANDVLNLGQNGGFHIIYGTPKHVLRLMDLVSFTEDDRGCHQQYIWDTKTWDFTNQIYEDLELLILDKADVMLTDGRQMNDIYKLYERLQKYNKDGRVEVALFATEMTRTLIEFTCALTNDQQMSNPAPALNKQQRPVAFENTIHWFVLAANKERKLGRVIKVLKLLQVTKAPVVIYCETQTVVDWLTYKLNSVPKYYVQIPKIHAVRKDNSDTMFRKFLAGEIQAVVTTAENAGGLDLNEHTSADKTLVVLNYNLPLEKFIQKTGRYVLL